jgi:hypothetical protein
MTRRLTDSERVRKLIAGFEFDDEQGLELQELLLVHGSRIAAVLGVALPELESKLQQPQERRSNDVRRLVRTAQEQREAIRAEQRRNLAIAAGIMLVGLARWNETRVELDARIVLGNLLVDASKKASDTRGREPRDSRPSRTRSGTMALPRGDAGAAPAALRDDFPRPGNGPAAVLASTAASPERISRCAVDGSIDWRAWLSRHVWSAERYFREAERRSRKACRQGRIGRRSECKARGRANRVTMTA